MATKKKELLPAEETKMLNSNPELDEMIPSEESANPQTETEDLNLWANIEEDASACELFPHTDSDTEQIMAEGSAAPDGASKDATEETLVPQTETETMSDGTRVARIQEGETSDNASFQTETETEQEKNPANEFSEGKSMNNVIVNTDPENAPAKSTDDVVREPENEGASPILSETSQSDTTPVKKPRRRKTIELKPQSDTTDTEKLPKESAAEGKPKKRAAAKPKQAVMSIDAQRTVETDADKAQNDLIDLLESQKTGRILTGTIQGVERSGGEHSHSMAVIYHGSFKVIIPAEEAVEAPDDFRDQNPNDVYHYLLTKRLGAEVDYIVKGIDADENIAVASRLDAMRAKRKQYYFGLDRDGNNLLYSGVCAEARVVSAIRAGIFAELFGLEIYIPLRELSYQRMMDASGYFQPGQRILVKVLEVDRSDRNHVRATASVKQAAENPYETALRKYTVGNRYVGSVSMVDTNGVFVALDGGIDCLCSYPKRGRPPRGARVTVRILGISHETNRIWGAITHMTVPR